MDVETSTTVTVLVPTSEVPRHLPQILPLLREAVLASEGLFDEESVRAALLDGTFDLWLVVDRSSVVGFMASELIPTAKGLDLNIPFAGCKKNIRAVNDALKEIVRVAKESGYHSVRFISKDPRFGGLAKRHEFRPRFMEWVKEL